MEEVSKTPAKRKRKSGPESRTSVSNSSPEHIGHTLLAAESESKRERNPFKVPLESLVEKGGEAKPHAATMSRTELLALSETIFIDGGSLRQIYETHLIGERGLRRLVSEHLKGGDLHNTLRMEVMEREMDFERDPKLRDKAKIETIETNDASLDELIDKASVGVQESGDQVAFYKAQASYEASQKGHTSQSRQLIDVAVVAFISFLLLLIIILIMAR